MSYEGRIDSLKSRHAAIDSQIATEDARPRPDEMLLHKLKIEKLHVKEQLEKLRTGQSAA
jgi:hypothetical protein